MMPLSTIVGGMTMVYIPSLRSPVHGATILVLFIVNGNSVECAGWLKIMILCVVVVLIRTHLS